ncbi:uncharacterized protein LOC142337932 [Convolutriloba macropyga]|uniref:uncharacterized protein LOC142337932 n=1 Tax=Convolutriloba macropyga TaxID=536237 RepID=UPI003F5253B7
MGMGIETCAGHKGDRGKKVTKLPKKKCKRPHVPKRKFVKDVVVEVMGYTPYERRAMELLRNQRDKRALKYIKQRLGSLQLAKKKREELGAVIMQART